MDYPIVFLALVAGLLLGLLVGWFWFSKGKKISGALQSQIDQKERELSSINVKVVEARSAIKTQEAEAKAQAKEILSQARLEAQELTNKLERESVRIEEKEKALDTKVTEVEGQRNRLQKQEEDNKQMQEELRESTVKHREALEKVSKLSTEEAKEKLSTELEKEFSGYFAGQVKEMKKRAEEDVEAVSKNLLAEAIHRYASEVATESTTTVVQLPSDDVKGRIIGKEGRNIVAFESATGIDVIIDDTPGAVVISGYDLVRRYVAKLALEKLVEDGRIQPARIEEVVNKVKEDVAKMMLEFGKRAVEELGITGYAPELLKIIGRLRFRTSYGQNILKHSVEMAHMGRIMAAEIGADEQIVVEGCLLHDIGKALDHEVAGTHVQIGVEIAKRFKVRPEVVHCIAAHHEDTPISSAEAFIVAAADAISGSRPGARRESMEAYIKRLTELENTARSFEGVSKAYAISAGREVRVFVDAGKVDDLTQQKLAKDIAKKIESELTYPGVIKVNVIRERRIEETAK
ncbi:MAG: ribonuclease Y [Candidatus Peribacteraceae bacterium]|nr:ribonuclease Y [Candidatus Peribacteraceae bacterium]